MQSKGGFVKTNRSLALAATAALAFSLQPAQPSTAQAPLPAGLIFTHNGSVWRAGQTGSITQLKWPDASQSVSYADLSTDGKRLLYQADGEIWLFDLASGQSRNITQSPARYDGSPQWWSENGQTVLFVTLDKEPVLPPGSISGLRDEPITVTSIRIDGSDPRTLFTTRVAPVAVFRVGSARPRFDALIQAARDERTVLIHRIDSDSATLGFQFFQQGKGTAPIGTRLLRGGRPGRNAPNMGVSEPNGARLAAFSFNKAKSWLTVIDLERNTLAYIDTVPGNPSLGLPGNAWSPDGRWLAYTVNANESYRRTELRIVNARTLKLQMVVPISDVENSFVWSSTGALALTPSDNEASLLVTPARRSVVELSLPEGARVVSWAQ